MLGDKYFALNELRALLPSVVPVPVAPVPVLACSATRTLYPLIAKLE
jgi:hypothetical protein